MLDGKTHKKSADPPAEILIFFLNKRLTVLEYNKTDLRRKVPDHLVPRLTGRPVLPIKPKVTRLSNAEFYNNPGYDEAVHIPQLKDRALPKLSTEEMSGANSGVHLLFQKQNHKHNHL